MSIRAVTYFVILAIVLLVDTQRPHAKTFNERASVCLGCHGEKGQSKTPETPSLGGQPAKQRVSGPMNDIDFSDDDLRLFSDNLSKLPPPLPPSSAPDAARMTSGGVLITKHRCNNCHDLDLSGRDNVPRIANQREDYLLKTLREYKNNTRHGYDGMMAEVLAPITEAQIVDLAYVIARFR